MSYFNKLFGKYKDEKDEFFYFLGHKFEKNKLTKKEFTSLLEIQKNEILSGVQRLVNTAFLHQKTFAEFKNKFLNKTVVLVAAGPSLNDFKPIEDAIYVGVNRTFLKDDVKFDYLFAIDNGGLSSGEKFLYDEFLNYRENDCIKFIGDQNMGAPFQIPEGKLAKKNVRRYKTTANFMPDKITLDIESEPLGNFASVSLQAMQFILYGNPKKIYIVGMDNNLSNAGHFFGEESCVKIGYTTLVQNEAKVVEAFKKMKEFAKIYYPDTEIVSLNPVGLKGIFKDEYYDKNVEIEPIIEEKEKTEIEKFLNKINFNNKLKALNKKLKGKKVLIYGAGQVFETIYSKYDLKEFNIVGISDKCFKERNEFFGISTIPYSELKNVNADCILVCVRNYLSTIEELENILPKNIKIIPFVKQD